MHVPKKFSNAVWLAIGVTVLMTVFVMLLMGVGELLS